MQIYKYSSLDSSQEESKRLIETHVELPFLVLTKTQESGKGTKNRSWFSPEGGLYMTLCLELDFNLLKDQKDIQAYSNAACLKTVEVLKNNLCSFFDNSKLDELRIKPINDLYFKEAKLAGILLETVNKHKNTFLLIGIGMNLKKIESKDLDREIISLEELIEKRYFKDFDLEKYLDLLTKELIVEIKAL